MKQIIIVDDDSTNNYICETMIRKLIKEVSVISFLNPLKALDYLISNKTDFDGLVIIDVNMPEMSGWQLINLMHENKIMVPIIILTSSISYQDKESARKIEMIKNFFTKPIDPTMIIKIRDYI